VASGSGPRRPLIPPGPHGIGTATRAEREREASPRCSWWAGWRNVGFPAKRVMDDVRTGANWANFADVRAHKAPRHGRPAARTSTSLLAPARHVLERRGMMARARSSPCAALVLLLFLAAAAASSITRRDFPPGFVFGVGSSAYQVYIACCSPSMAFLLESCASPIYSLLLAI
jgi:hypothetical protein